MNKQELFNKLKAAGKIPDNLTIDMVTETYLLGLDFQTPAPAVDPLRSQLSMDDFQELIAQEFDNRVQKLGIDKIDLKYAKLPNAELTAEETEGLSEAEISSKKMLKFVQHLYSSGSKYTVFPGRNLALNTEASDSVGKYTVPVEFIAEVSRLLNLYGAFRRNAKYRTFNSLTATMPKIASQPQGAYRSTDSTAYSESNMTFGQVLFTAKDYGFISGISRNLLQDSGVDLIGLLAELVAVDFTRNEDAQGFLGTGSPITGVAASITDTNYIVTTGTTNPASLILANWISLITKPKSRALAGNPKWYFEKSVLGLYLSLEDDNSRPIFTESDKKDIISSKRILNYPYELTDGMNTSADSGGTKPIVLFGDLSQCATFAERVGLDIAVSDSATVGGNSAFEKKLTFFAFDTRHDIQVEQPEAMSKMITHA